jgi:hypothetical protein
MSSGKNARPYMKKKGKKDWGHDSSGTASTRPWIQTLVLPKLIHLINFFIVALGGVHCGIYKSSYSISNIS